MKNGKLKILGSGRALRAGGAVPDKQLVKQLMRRDAALAAPEVRAISNYQ